MGVDPCAICGTYQRPTVDHIVPRSRGGTDDPANLRPLCVWCNSVRNDSDWTDARVLERRLENYMDRHAWRARYQNPHLVIRARTDRQRTALLALPLFGGIRNAVR
jgi:hypothetical protein